jgi:hypothetical protein
MSEGRDPTEQVARPRARAAQAGPSRFDRALRYLMATLVALILVIAAGLVFAETLLRPSVPEVAASPTPTASASASESPSGAPVFGSAQPARATAAATARPTAASATPAPTRAPTPPPTPKPSR